MLATFYIFKTPKTCKANKMPKKINHIFQLVAQGNKDQHRLLTSHHQPTHKIWTKKNLVHCLRQQPNEVS